MALPLTTQTTQQAYSQLQQAGLALKNQCATVQAGNYAANIIAGLLSQALTLQSFAVALAGNSTMLTAVAVYVSSLTGEPAANVGTDFQTSLTALQALIAAVIKDYPVSNGVCQDRLIDANGNITWVTLAALPNTMPAIAGWLATVA